MSRQVNDERSFIFWVNFKAQKYIVPYWCATKSRLQKPDLRDNVTSNTF